MSFWWWALVVTVGLAVMFVGGCAIFRRGCRFLRGEGRR